MAIISMPEALRRKAERTRSEAERNDAPEVRIKMLEIAAEFELLAELAEQLSEEIGRTSARRLLH
jgi:hypothetical protein